MTKEDSDSHWRPLGQAMLDYFHGERYTNIVVQCSVERDRDVPLGVFFREGPLPKIEKRALKYCYGRTLDAGAGTGVHALLLQDRGLNVTALDISAEACQVMQERGLKQVICSSIFELNEGPFDTVLMMMNGIGLAENPAGLDKLLAHLKSLLNPQGQLICDSTDIAYVTPEMRARASVAPPAEEAYYGTVWYRLCYKGRCGEPYPWLFVDKDTLGWYARKNGFRMEILATDREQFLARLVSMGEN